MKKHLLLLVFVFSFLNSAFSQTAPVLPDSIKKYVLAALDTMKLKALRKHTVDWEKVYAKTLTNAQKAKTVRDTYPVLLKTVKSLDAHGNFASPELAKAYEGGYRSNGMQVPFATGGMVEGKYAYIKVPDFAVIDKKEKVEYADSLQNLIKRLDQQNPKGWILDLRGNWGGMLDPMMAGVAPLLGDGKWLGFEDADKNEVFWEVRDGQLVEKDSVLMAVSNSYRVKNTKAPISILTDKNTASSGEMVAMAFVGRPHTKLIGTNTAGATTSNEGIKLQDGAFLILTTSVTFDRTGKRYGKHMEPDVKLTDLTGVNAIDNTAYMQAAVKFLKNPKK
ncbi:S41 family peptidase [Rufibacter sp. LB8]|uniref:S41 family peptidase n=1 Tax=Rufibacter sp. LB8 TaxID=2777781 RepID=UPI00178C5EE5|nr:S41 family peptidase [Rufibacter sp. LB8]